MIVIRGSFYDGKTSAQVPAECRVYRQRRRAGARRRHGRAAAGPAALRCRRRPRAWPTRRATSISRTARSSKPRTTVQSTICCTACKRRPRAARRARSGKPQALHPDVPRGDGGASSVGVGRYGVPAAARAVAHRLPSTVVQKAGQPDPGDPRPGGLQTFSARRNVNENGCWRIFSL
ncbi:MAG: hypothetical protein MZV70_76070 [Desulfobacterales bacterium]|nr:hypothetical protein [Desulfobacterales bacterium]